MFKTLTVLTNFLALIYVLYPDGCVMLEVKTVPNLPKSGYFGNTGKYFTISMNVKKNSSYIDIMKMFRY